MKLFYSPGACSHAPHILLRESGLDFAIEKVDLGAKKTESGADFKKISPHGYVPALQLDNGTVLTEGPAIDQYIADLVPAKKLAPANGTPSVFRVRVGKFTTRREAETVAARLQKEEQFKPWVTR